MTPPRPEQATEEEEGEEGSRRSMSTGGTSNGVLGGRSCTSMSSSAATSASPSASASASAASGTINLSREYTLAIHTASYNEVWAKIHPPPDLAAAAAGGDGDSCGEEDSSTLARVLQPDRASIEQALRATPDTRLTRLVSAYFHASERTSLLCLSLRRALLRARSLYGPITDLLGLLPSAPPLALTHCDCALDAFLLFDGMPNPFPAPSPSSSSSSSQLQSWGMRRCFLDLKEQLDLRLLRARRRHRLLRCATRGSGVCLVACTAGIAVAGLVLATHAMAAVMAAAPACISCSGCSSCSPAATAMEQLQEHMEQLDAAARGTYVLSNDLDTIERLVARLHGTVESDKMLVRLGLERGRGQHHAIEEVVRQLRKNHPSLLHQLADLDEHICLYFASVNRARTLLLRHIDSHPPFFGND